MLFLLPVDRKIDWANPPVVTIALILLNSFIFLVIQDAEITEKYAFHQDDPVTYLTSMFLHGSLMHLIGNMVILFLAGFVIERTLGHINYLLAYLAGGLLAIGLWAIVYADKSGLGASGAISAVMGLYSMLFGLRRIRFFYIFLFYFDYIKAPAIILLPLWLLNEAYGLYQGHGNIGYVAHIGGFLGGAATGWYFLNSQKHVDTDYLEENERQEEWDTLLNQGMQFVEQLEFGRARTVFRQMLETDPKNEMILKQLYQLSRQAPDSEDFHRYAGQLLSLYANHTQMVEALRETFLEYMQLARPASRIRPELITRIAMILARAGHISDSERFIVTIAKKRPDTPLLPDALLALAEAISKQGDREKSKKYRDYLLAKYPQSNAANKARHDTLMN